eukprot:g5518.t1
MPEAPRSIGGMEGSVGKYGVNIAGYFDKVVNWLRKRIKRSSEGKVRGSRRYELNRNRDVKFKALVRDTCRSTFKEGQELLVPSQTENFNILSSGLKIQVFNGRSGNTLKRMQLYCEKVIMQGREALKTYLAPRFQDQSLDVSQAHGKIENQNLTRSKSKRCHNNCSKKRLALAAAVCIAILGGLIVLILFLLGFFDSVPDTEQTDVEVFLQLSGNNLLLDQNTIFKVPLQKGKLQHAFLYNKVSNVFVGDRAVNGDGFSFRNPPHFMPLVGEMDGNWLWYPEIKARYEAELETEAVIDYLIDHKNTPAFIGKKIIQRFVTSNPTPRYVKVVADAFRKGTYEGSSKIFSGKRGDLAATLAATLLDREARSSTLLSDPSYGQFREPLVKHGKALYRWFSDHRSNQKAKDKFYTALCEQFDLNLDQCKEMTEQLFQFTTRLSSEENLKKAVEYVANIWKQDGVRKLEKDDKPKQKNAYQKNAYQWFSDYRSNQKAKDKFYTALCEQFDLNLEQCKEMTEKLFDFSVWSPWKQNILSRKLTIRSHVNLVIGSKLNQDLSVEDARFYDRTFKDKKEDNILNTLHKKIKWTNEMKMQDQLKMTDDMVNEDYQRILKTYQNKTLWSLYKNELSKEQWLKLMPECIHKYYEKTSEEIIKMVDNMTLDVKVGKQMRQYIVQLLFYRWSDEDKKRLNIEKFAENEADFKDFLRNSFQYTPNRMKEMDDMDGKFGKMSVEDIEDEKKE